MATTPTTTRADFPQLDKLAQRLNAWRSIRTRGQRIPEAFWKAATLLARKHGLNPTAAALKLNYYDLQRRLTGRRGQRKDHATPAPFLQLAPPAWPPSVSEPGTLELVQPSGTRLTLRLPHACPKDLLPLVHLFLRHRS